MEQTARRTTHFFIFSRMFAILPNRFCEDEKRNAVVKSVQRSPQWRGAADSPSFLTWAFWATSRTSWNFSDTVRSSLGGSWGNSRDTNTDSCQSPANQSPDTQGAVCDTNSMIWNQPLITCQYKTNVDIKLFVVVCLSVFSYDRLRDFGYNAPLNPPASESSASWVQTDRYKVISYPGHSFEWSQWGWTSNPFNTWTTQPLTWRWGNSKRGAGGRGKGTWGWPSRATLHTCRSVKTHTKLIPPSLNLPSGNDETVSSTIVFHPLCRVCVLFIESADCLNTRNGPIVSVWTHNEGNGRRVDGVPAG